MHSAVQRAVGILDEAGFPNRPIGAQENGDRVGGAMIGSGGELWIRLRAGAANVGLGVALQAALAVERWPEAKKCRVAGRVIGSVRSYSCAELYESIDPKDRLLDRHVGNRMAGAAGRLTRSWPRIEHISCRGDPGGHSCIDRGVTGSGCRGICSREGC